MVGPHIVALVAARVALLSLLWTSAVYSTPPARDSNDLVPRQNAVTKMPTSFCEDYVDTTRQSTGPIHFLKFHLYTHDGWSPGSCNAAWTRSLEFASNTLRDFWKTHDWGIRVFAPYLDDEDGRCVFEVLTDSVNVVRRAMKCMNLRRRIPECVCTCALFAVLLWCMGELWV